MGLVNALVRDPQEPDPHRSLSKLTWSMRYGTDEIRGLERPSDGANKGSMGGKNGCRSLDRHPL